MGAWIGWASLPASAAPPEALQDLAGEFTPPTHTAERSLEIAQLPPAPGKVRLVGGEKEGAPPVEIHVQAKGTSDSKTRKAAIAELPINKLTPENQKRVQHLLSDLSYYRRLPTTVVAADPEMYQYFVNCPDVTVSIWRAMGISEMQLWQTAANEYEGDAGDGTVGIIDVLHRGVDQCLILCEGQFQSPILRKPIKARSLVLLTSSFFRETDGQVYVTHRADLFVQFPSQTIDAAAKILSPLTNSMVDRTFTEMSLFLRMMTLAMIKRPGWVEQIASRLEGVPEVRKTQLLQVAANVHTQELKRLGLVPEQAAEAQPVPATANRAARSNRN